MDKAERSFFKRILGSITLLSLELVIVWVFFLTSVIVFLIVSREIFIQNEQNFDVKVFEFLDQYVPPSVTRFMQIISFFASKEFIIPACMVIVLYFILIKKHKWYSINVPVVAIGSISLNLILKFFFNRPRPLLSQLSAASGLSFPSGHAMMSFSFYGLIIYLVWINVKHKPLKYVLVFFLLFLILMIGLSRVYLRVHYATDVLAGFAVGIIWLVISIVLLKRIEKFSGRKLDQYIDED